MLDPVYELIEQSFLYADEKAFHGKLGFKFLEFVAKKKRENETGIIIDPITDAKIKYLRQCEDQGDMGWMDLGSWNALHPYWRSLIEECIDPLLWGAIYFQYSSFYQRIETLPLDTNTQIFILRDMENFQIVCLNSEYTIGRWMDFNRFCDLQKEFKNRIIHSIGGSDSGIVIRHFKREGASEKLPEKGK